ncbi:MAG: HAD family hydrolase [Acidimicrobiales bacterium]
MKVPIKAGSSCLHRPHACLIDVYQTMVSCDFNSHRTELPELAQVPGQLWNAAFEDLAPWINDGRLSMAAAFSHIIEQAGKVPEPALIARLVRRDYELLVETGVLHDDVVPFLVELRARGLKSAILSNCAHSTRDLLVAHGLVPLVDAVILSCEIRSSKPSPGAFLTAVNRLGVEPGSALFVDDQAANCEAASALGMMAVRIARGQAAGPGAIASLSELGSLLWTG